MGIALCAIREIYLTFDKEIESVQVYDNRGAAKQLTGEKIVDGHYRISVDMLPAGIYVLEVRYRDGLQHQRFVKK